MTQKVNVLYFAGVKDITKKESEEVDIQNENWSLTDLSQILVEKYGAKMNEMLNISMYAVDMEYIEKESESTTTIKPNSEIAIIPPVSGG